ncbi:helix-turn-helix domain protein [Acidaminococcus sp. CAG:917]|nr:helix-turn-helix domain protein [Acidaminococcus sp. CAG:917]
MNQFATRIYELRLEAGMTRAQLAQKLGVSVRTISYWESGERECSFDMLLTICALFNTTADYLLGKSEY